METKINVSLRVKPLSK
jgi:centromeric protein E